MTREIVAKLEPADLDDLERGTARLVLSDSNGQRHHVDPRRQAVSRRFLWVVVSALVGLIVSNVGGFLGLAARLDKASRDRFGGAHFSEVQHALEERNSMSAMQARSGWKGLDAAEIVDIQRTVALRDEL